MEEDTPRYTVIHKPYCLFWSASKIYFEDTLLFVFLNDHVGAEYICAALNGAWSLGYSQAAQEGGRDVDDIMKNLSLGSNKRMIRIEKKRFHWPWKVSEVITP